MNVHRVFFLIYPGISPFDVAGPAKALAIVASRMGRYEVTLISDKGGLVESDCPGVSFDSVPSLPTPPTIDTLFIPGGVDAPTASKDRELVACTKRLAESAKRVACVCTGAFLAAEAGLLTGKRAATHWRYCDRFAERFHDVKLEVDPIWVQDGKVWSSAGVSAGVDLTLGLIEEDHGGPEALRVARELVVFLKRPGGQSQFSTVLSGQIADADGTLGPVLAWIANNLKADLRADTLADKANMSVRTFARSFVARTGMTPAKAVELIRIQAARDAIEQSRTPLGVIAVRCGFGDEQRMRRAFMRQLKASPADIRARFSIAQASRPRTARQISQADT
jgi:transcriptional regulator GlxA family with amidase domain